MDKHQAAKEALALALAELKYTIAEIEMALAPHYTFDADGNQVPVDDQ